MARRTIIKDYATISVSALLLLLTSCIFDRSPSCADKAKTLSESGQFSEAISMYTRHIENRLDIQPREDNENPFFYFLLIGDAYLSQQNYKAAEAAYSVALDRSVNQELIADRIHTLSKALIEKNELNAAWDLLTRYRDTDPLMFDYYLSELHRTMVAKAEQGTAEQGGTAQESTTQDTH